MNPPPPPHLPPPPPPPSSASYTPLPPPFSHNPNPFFPPPSHLPYQPPSTTTTTTSPNLPTALSTLTSLLHLSQSTLNSLPTPTSTSTSTSTPTLIPCPFNPNHHLPPSSLFSHYLQCPSSPTPLHPNPLLSSLHYPHTLHHSSTPTPPHNPTSPLSFSLENHFDFASNFFYSDCPAVVTHPNNHPSPPFLTLPEVLSVKCADFVESNCSHNAKGFGIGSIKLLPSEIWAIRNEVEEWRDYPGSYSCRVVRTILGLEMTSLVDFPTWVVVSSPKYGVVIDFAMRDHIVLLFRLCLKAIIDEAIGFGESLFSVEVKEKDKGVDDQSFSCPVLGRVLMWLASQLTVLYGEVNGKFFAISMLRQCVLDASLDSSVFAELRDSEKVDGTAEERVEHHSENDGESTRGGTIGKSTIFVSQVAAAVAALHEISILQEKIRALRDSRPLTAYQRIVEHETISRIADEERKRRPNYKPLTEHDGFLRHQSFNEETNKMKTREEILAEERDYKRRRMSYRGKKLKRSRTEVMRDLIEVYMEEMKQANGIGCSEKGSEEGEALASETFPMHDNSADIYKATKNLDDSSEISRGQPYSNRKLLDSRDNTRSMESKNVYLEGKNLHRRDSHSYHIHLESDRSVRRPRREEDNTRSPDERRSRRNVEDYSGSPERQRSKHGREDYSRSSGKRRSRRDREDYSRSPDERQSSRHAFGRSSRDTQYGELSRELFSRSSEGSYSGSNKRHGHQREESGHDLELKNKRGGKSHWKRSASEFQDRYNSIADDEFEDRYNPVESHDTYEENS